MTTDHDGPDCWRTRNPDGPRPSPVELQSRIEQELRAEVERLKVEASNYAHDRDEARAEVQHLTAQLAQVTRERDDRSRVLQDVIKQRDTAYRARDEARHERDLTEQERANARQAIEDLRTTIAAYRDAVQPQAHETAGDAVLRVTHERDEAQAEVERLRARPGHGMIPGSHERPDGPECRCGAAWDRQNDRCTTAPATVDGADLLALIRRGINDPGSVLPRETVNLSDGTGVYDERIGAWGARAVLHLLTAAGWPNTYQPDNPHVERARQAREKLTSLVADILAVAADLDDDGPDRLPLSPRKLAEALRILVAPGLDPAMNDGWTLRVMTAAMADMERELIGHGFETGSVDDGPYPPWEVAMGAIGDLRMDLAAEKDQTQQLAAEVERLREGWRLDANTIAATRNALVDTLGPRQSELALPAAVRALAGERDEARRELGRLREVHAAVVAGIEDLHRERDAERERADQLARDLNLTEQERANARQALDECRAKLKAARFAGLGNSLDDSPETVAYRVRVVVNARAAAEAEVERLRAGIEALIVLMRQTAQLHGGVTAALLLDGVDRLRDLLADGPTPAPNATRPLYVDHEGKPTGEPRVEVTANVHIVPASSPTADHPAPGQGQDTTETQEANHG